MLTDYVAFSLYVVLALFVMSFAIRRMTQALSLYILHDMRDRLFDAASSVEGGLDDHFTKMLDCMLAYSIYTVRDQKYSDAVDFAVAISDSDKSSNVDGESSAKRNDELCVSRTVQVYKDSPEALREIIGDSKKLPAVLFIRVMGGNPFLYLLAVFSAVVSFAFFGSIKLAKLAFQNDKSREVEVLDDLPFISNPGHRRLIDAINKSREKRSPYATVSGFIRVVSSGAPGPAVIH